LQAISHGIIYFWTLVIIAGRVIVMAGTIIVA
jgi:hypothetical protein